MQSCVLLSLSVMVTMCLVISGCKEKAGGSGEGADRAEQTVPTDSPDANKPRSRSQSVEADRRDTQEDELPTKDAEYKSAVSAFAKEELFEDLTEERAYSLAIEQNMHYLYVAFLEVFPQSQHELEILRRTEKFGVLGSPPDKEYFVTDAELKSKYNFNGMTRLYRWGPAEAGFRITNERQRLAFGQVCFGNLQLISGGFIAHVVDGVEGLTLIPGTKFIYPLEK